jgi:ATP-binding cassette subfamily C protein CydD
VQRLALARAFLRDAPLLILDEPTANLDPAAAEHVGRALDRLCAGRSVLIVAHEPELARRADRIATLDGGRVAELAWDAA